MLHTYHCPIHLFCSYHLPFPVLCQLQKLSQLQQCLILLLFTLPGVVIATDAMPRHGPFYHSVECGQVLCVMLT